MADARPPSPGRRVPRGRIGDGRCGPPVREIIVTEASGQSGKTIRDLRIRHETGSRDRRRCARRTATFDTTPDPDAVLDTGDVMIAAGSGDEPALLEELFRPTRAGCPLERSRDSRPSSGFRWSAPRVADHGDFATNAALQLAPAAEARAARDRRGARRAGDGARTGRAGRGSRARLREPLVGAGLVRRCASARSSRRGKLRRRVRRSGRSGCRSRWSQPTRPARSRSPRRATARTATRSRASSVTPGHEVEREYYYNDAGAQMERFRASVEAVRRGEEPPEDGYQGAYVAELARDRGRSGAADARADRGRRSSASGSTSTRGRSRASSRSACRSSSPRLDTYEKDGAVWARSSAYGDDDDRVIIRSPEQGGTPTYRAADIVYLVGQARARLRPGDLRARRRPSRHAPVVRGGRADARLRPRARRSAALPARPSHPGWSSRRRSRSGAATSSSSTTSWTRSGSTLRAGTSSTAGPIRRSTSTSTSRRRRRRRTRSTTSSTPTRGSRASSATPPRRRVTVCYKAPEALAPEEKELIKRLVEFPAIVAEAVERRGPHALPNYAIRVADDFHRFYHEHRVLESRPRSSGSRSSGRRRP